METIGQVSTDIKKEFSEAYVKIFQKAPKDEEELIIFGLANWLIEERELLQYCARQTSLLLLAIRGEEGINDASKMIPKDYTKYALVTFAKALEMLIDLQNMAEMRLEVEKRLEEAMKMEVK
jgi:hypothetical protein